MLLTVQIISLKITNTKEIVGLDNSKRRKLPKKSK